MNLLGAEGSDPAALDLTRRTLEQKRGKLDEGVLPRHRDALAALSQARALEMDIQAGGRILAYFDRIGTDPANQDVKIRIPCTYKYFFLFLDFIYLQIVNDNFT